MVFLNNKNMIYFLMKALFHMNLAVSEPALQAMQRYMAARVRHAWIPDAGE
jgi:hypothetical protein